MNAVTNVVVILLIATSLHAKELPAGFRLQELSPIGGEIPMPDTWHHEGGMTASGFMFMISKEKNADGSYETGMRIQGITDVNQRAGISAHEAIVFNKERFKKEAKQIIKDCDVEHAAPFKKTCLEVIQANPKDPNEDFHVIYSFFWNDEMDMMVTTIYGAPESKWAEAEKIYITMKDFVLIDATKIKEEKAKASADQ